ncbi:hypothetical protein DPMN_048428 [Dreissena polymorpha]|uniref:Uncharacterized protein n=1 Tax=Dreissena polymorpha TaxID=45954 RepID=A0A9D4DA02_DREPO|nr:hypothetical protein DPMN_048428 [Dreissena polymorpha]
MNRESTGLTGTAPLLYRGPYRPRQSYENAPMNAVRVPKTCRGITGDDRALPGSDSGIDTVSAGGVTVYRGYAGLHRGTTGDHRGYAGTLPVLIGALPATTGLHLDKPVTALNNFYESSLSSPVDRR